MSKKFKDLKKNGKVTIDAPKVKERRKFAPATKVEKPKKGKGAYARKKVAEEDEEKKACWKGYKKQGMKKKGGKMVNNCVKESWHAHPQENNYYYDYDNMNGVKLDPPKNGNWPKWDIRPNKYIDEIFPVLQSAKKQKMSLDELYMRVKQQFRVDLNNLSGEIPTLIQKTYNGLSDSYSDFSYNNRRTLQRESSEIYKFVECILGENHAAAQKHLTNIINNKLQKLISLEIEKPLF